MKTYKILGLLLTYPQGALLDAREELYETLRAEALLPQKMIKRVQALLETMASWDIYDLQEEYVKSFDQSRAHSLHIFEHIHGESRDRGQAMVDLMAAYEAKGLYIATGELPDYLPLFMEFLSLCGPAEARESLSEIVDVVALIGQKLAKRQAIYAPVFEAIVALSSVRPDQSKIEKAIKTAPRDPETLEEIDQEWKELEAFSGDPLADSQNCQTCNTFPNTTHEIEKMLGGIQ